MKSLVTTGEVRPWEGVALVIELRAEGLQVVMSPGRAEEIARKLLALAGQFVTDEDAEKKSTATRASR